MHAFLIVGNLKEGRDPSALLGMTEVRQIEFPFAKVADVRELDKFIKLKLTEKTAIILRDFDKASTEAQNAFLKSLEEPQENLTYILTATNIEKVLPTIVSRCEVKDVYSMSYIVSGGDREKIKSFINSKTGDKFLTISKINKREEAMEFVKKIIIVGHEMFLEDPTKVGMLTSANKTLRNLELNGNVILQLTNFVIYFDSNAS